MQTHAGPLAPELMQHFPSRTAAAAFHDWLPNHVGLEQLLSVAGFLNPDFYEVSGFVFWHRHTAQQLARPEVELSTESERAANTINLVEFFLMAADEALESRELVESFGEVLRSFWGVALRLRFPDRRFRFELAEGLYGETGLCLTFWQVQE